MAYNIIPQRGVFSTIANLINENFQRIYQQILGLDGSGEQAAEDISQLESDVSVLQAGKANDADVVHKAGTETITGNKTFTGTVKMPLQNSGILVTDENGVVQSDSNTYAGAQTSGGAANKAVSIPFGQVDSTSTSTAFTATVDGITELRDGVCVYLKNGVANSASGCTLNVNGLGAKRILYTMAAASAVTTQWNINYTMLFIYNSTRMEGGCWDMYYGYYSDGNSIGWQLKTNSYTLPASDTSRYYKIFFTSADNTKWVPASADSTNNATSARPVNQRPINPFGPIVYTTSNANFTAGTNVTTTVIWQQYPLALGYSFNRTGAALTLTTSKPVYIKCAPQNDGSAIIDADTPYVQDLPTSEDGKIYIFLGVAYSATHVEMQMVHPVYYYKNGSINLWTGTGVQTDVSKSTESNVIDVGNYDLMKINEVKGKSLVMNQLVQNGDVEINQTFPAPYSSPLTRQSSINMIVGHKYYAAVDVWNDAQSVVGEYNFAVGDINNYFSIGPNKSRNAVIITQVTGNFPKRVNVGYTASQGGDGITVYTKNVILIDLTQMFGAGNEPTTVEEVEAILGNDYYEYNTGEVVGNNVEKLDVTGFNIWDEEWEQGNINSDGSNEGNTEQRIRSKNYIPVFAGASYFFECSSKYAVLVFDANKSVIGWFMANSSTVIISTQSFQYTSCVLTMPSNAAYIRFVTATTYGATYKNDICINKSNASKNGTYEPYKHSEFPLNLTELTGKGYTELEYIESSGTQYIDTGIFFTANDKIEFKIRPLVNSGDTAFFGCYQNGAMKELGTFNGMFRFDVQTNQVSISTTQSYIISFNNGWYVDGQFTTSGINNTNTSHSLILFGRYYNNKVDKKGSSRFYYYKHERNSQLILNLIPAKRNSDNAIGMYDTVSNTFFTNAGTGAFIAGAEVPLNNNIPSVTIFPDGLHGVGTAYDSLIVDDDGYARRAVKRMGSVDLGSLSWTYNSSTTPYFATPKAALNVNSHEQTCISAQYSYVSDFWNASGQDMCYCAGKSNFNIANSSYTTAADFKAAMSGVLFCYKLATPIEYVLDTPVQCVAKVYPNGTVKQVPVMPDSTPMVMDVTYLHDTGGVIGGLMNRLASLEPRMDDLAKGIKTISVQYGDASSIVLETEKINGNEGTVSIPAATSQAAGAMSAAQAALLEDLSDLADDIETLLASI